MFTLEAITNLTPEQQIEYIFRTLPLLAERSAYTGREEGELVSWLLRRKLPFTPEQILKLVELGADPSYYFPFTPVLRYAESIPMTPELAQALERMVKARVVVNGQFQAHIEVKRRIHDLLHPKDPKAPFQPAGAWSRSIAGELTGTWRGVLEAGAEIAGREPSKKWRDAAAARVAEIGRDPFREVALRWLALGPSPGDPNGQTSTGESDYQRGFLWSLTQFPDAEMCAAVARFAEQCLRKIPSLGAVSQKSGNASVGVLSAMGGTEAVAQLARLALRIRYHTAQRLVQEALEEAARKQGLTRDELEEITVPTFGLDVSGRRVERCGERCLILDSSGALSCETADGKALKSIPEAVKRDFAEELKELKQAAKEIAPMRQAHRLRLERLLLTERAIRLETWRSAYIDHPLLAGMARRLIWQFDSGATAIWRDSGFVDWSGSTVRPEGAVRLWHPIRSDVQGVLSWRCWLEDNRVQQPFKQAHREVYLVTDAERASSPGSNRFASHILRQQQFVALCAERGWRFKVMGEWDSHNNPYVEIPHAGLRAELDVDFPEDESVYAHAIYVYLKTQQVRFSREGIPVPIESVPAVVFSEIMRDVDLFVGITSIGSDPEWGARPNAPFLNYWESVSFGELSVAAQNRRQILESLVPKLAIRDRCRVEGRYLWVRGDRASYRIHVGSGNVMIEQGSRYLCIVKSASTVGDVFLPFDGDGMLSTILSKAFLLANDSKIKDPGILKQLP